MQTKSLQHGFTLIEVIIVAPLVILLIGITIGYISALTGDGLKTQQRNALAYSSQDALDIIDQDVSYALNFETTTGTLPSPQGKANGTAAFANSDPNTLILEAAATTANRLDPARQLIYIGTGTCNPSNPIYTYNLVYYVENGSLYKRTIVPSQDTCATPYQKNSCSPSVMQSSPPAICKVEDEKLTDNVQNLSLTYKANESVMSTSDAERANNIEVTLVLQKSVAGESLTYTGVLRSKKVN